MCLPRLPPLALLSKQLGFGHIAASQSADGKLSRPSSARAKGSELVAVQSAQIADLSHCRCPEITAALHSMARLALAVLAAYATALRPTARVARAPTQRNLFGGAPPEEDTPASPPPGQGGGQTMSVPGLGDHLRGNQVQAPHAIDVTRLTG